MQLRTVFARTRFGTDVIEDAIKVFADLAGKGVAQLDLTPLQVKTGPETWSFDNLDEFLAAHRKPHDSANLWAHGWPGSLHIDERSCYLRKALTPAPMINSAGKVPQDSSDNPPADWGKFPDSERFGARGWVTRRPSSSR